MYFSLRHVLFFHFLSSVNLTNVYMTPNGKVDVVEHQVKEFHCIVDNLSTPVIRWYINSTEVQEATNMTIENNTLIFVYEYVGSKTDLSQTIYCEASNNGRTFQSINAILNVIYGPERGIYQELVGGFFMSGGLHVGWSVNLSCHGDCNPPCTHKWLKHGFYFSMREYLIFDALKKEDDGIYTCVVRNVITNLEYRREKRVVVVYGPEKAELSPDKYVYTIPEFSHRSFGIYCSAVGCKPQCMTQMWNKIDNRYGNYSYVKMPHSVLSFENITRSDAGKYSCYVANRVSWKYSHDVEINVIYGPQKSVSISPPNTRVSQSIKLPLNPIRCSADCYPPCQYQWLKDSEIVKQEQIFSINVLKKTDNGNYTCRAWNEAGEELINITLTVNYGPENIILSPDQTTYILTEYDSLPAIACYSDCQPTCSAIWVGPNLNKRSHVLNLTIVNRTQSGDYKCFVNNTCGSKYSKTIRIMVEYSPEVISFKLNKGKTIDSIDQKVTLTCNADGLPRPRIVWSLNDTVVGHLDNTTSHEFTASCQSSGTYTCTAINHLGRKSKVVDIVVFCNMKSYSTSSPLLCFPEGIGAGAGGVLIIVFLILIIFIVNMKRKKKQLLQNCAGYEETNTRNRQSSVYDELREYSRDRDLSTRNNIYDDLQHVE